MSNNNNKTIFKSKGLTLRPIEKWQSRTNTSMVVKENGLIYIRTDRNSEKIKRAKNNPLVRVTPCSACGFPKC
ncbi:MAG TPA: hypothetical protein VFJ51_09725 [Nitrososphaeraceae archaeon]|nr:hypothetical protein [Nitrososphaeraceae archaeon]